jgi:hypothetical protein
MSASALASTLTGLPRDDKARLLAQFAYYLAIAARGAYLEAGATIEASSRQLRGFNELQLIANSELNAVVEESGGRSRTAVDLVSSLQHWAGQAGINEELEWAARRALLSMGDRSIQPAPETRVATPGDFVILTKVPPGLLDDLPESDQIAIREIVGKPVLLESYDEDGRAALHFTDAEGTFHWIYVDSTFIRAADRKTWP